VVWLAAIVFLYLLLLFAVAWFSIHPFRTPLFISPGSLGSPQEEFQIASTDGIQLKCWWVPAPEAKTVAILCHGYVMNRSELTPVACWLWQRGISALLIEFRAHGHTRGGVSTIGYRESDDVVAAIQEARNRCPDCKIILIGSSMGSAASAFAAAKVPVDGVVLDSAYSKLVDASFGWWRFLGGRWLSWLFGPTILLAGPLVRMNPFRVDVAAALETIHCPVLMLHGRCDNLALPEQAERNYAAAGGPKELVWFDQCGHSEFRWVQSERYYQALENWLCKHNFLPKPEMS
jgi:alpha-beta hydrolase superfamily lysophospholipase